MLETLDAMPEKRLIAEESCRMATGAVFALSAASSFRHSGVDMSKLDPEDLDRISERHSVLHRHSCARSNSRTTTTSATATAGTRTSRTAVGARQGVVVVEQLAPPKRSDYVSNAFYQKARQMAGEATGQRHHRRIAHATR